MESSPQRGNSAKTKAPYGRSQFARWYPTMILVAVVAVIVLVVTMAVSNSRDSGLHEDRELSTGDAGYVALPPMPNEIQALDDALERGEVLRESGNLPSDSPLLLELDSALESGQLLVVESFPSRLEVVAITAQLDAILGEVAAAARQENLSAEIDALVGSAAAGVVAIDAASGQTIVSVNPDLQLTSASLYKLFVAYSMFTEVNNGAWSWDDPLIDWRTLGQCFDDMIIESDNDCPEAWLMTVGVETVSAQVQVLGLTNTVVAWSDMRTTAGDMAHFLDLVVMGDVLSPEDRLRLTGAMEVQNYREGIPAGIPSAVVWDKVGFFEGLLHDAAVVKSDKGEMILVILTEGSSWETIAEVASAVYNSY